MHFIARLPVLVAISFFTKEARLRRVREIPKLGLSKSLKLAYDVHETQGTLDLKDPNMDGVLDIYDLGVVSTHLITKISAKAEGAPPKPPSSKPRKPEA